MVVEHAWACHTQPTQLEKLCQAAFTYYGETPFTYLNFKSLKKKNSNSSEAIQFQLISLLGLFSTQHVRNKWVMINVGWGATGKAVYHREEKQ